MKLTKIKTCFRPLLFVGLFSLFCSFSANTQSITGIWLTENDEAKVEIYEQNGEFFGKVIWAKEQTEKAQEGVGTVILKNFVRQKDGTYKGNIFAPQNTFKGRITVKSENEISVRGYVGFSLLGSSQQWKREIKK